MSGEHPSRRKFIEYAGALALSTVGGMRSSEAAEIQRGMTWEQAVAAFQDDISRGVVEQRAHVARMKNMRTLVFHARKGLVASVPPDPETDQRELDMVIAQERDIARIGVFHQHQYTAIGYGSRAQSEHIPKSHRTDLRSRITHKGGKHAIRPESSPFSVEDIEHSAMDSTYGLALPRNNQPFDIVHGVFDPFGLWYYEMVSPAHTDKLTPEQMTHYTEDLLAAEHIQSSLDTLTVQTLRILLGALAPKIRHGSVFEVSAEATKEETLGEILLALSYLYNRGIAPSQVTNLRDILRHYPEVVDAIEKYFAKQRKQLDTVERTFTQLRIRSSQLGYPHDDDIRAFQQAAFRAWGALSRFVAYKNILREKPLAGIFND